LECEGGALNHRFALESFMDQRISRRWHPAIAIPFGGSLFGCGTSDVDYRPQNGTGHAHDAVRDVDSPLCRHPAPHVAHGLIGQLETYDVQRRRGGDEPGQIDEQIEREPLGR
jgi:hypothetical protein